MKLFDSYCYADINAVASQYYSKSTLGDGWVIDSATILNADSFNVSAISNNKIWSFTVTPPNCEKLGFDNSFTGLDTTDALHLSALCVSLLVTAFCMKVLKRPL